MKIKVFACYLKETYFGFHQSLLTYLTLSIFKSVKEDNLNIKFSLISDVETLKRFSTPKTTPKNVSNVTR